MDDGLGVGPGPVDVPGAFECGPDIRVVVDLAIEDDPDRAVLVRERLMASREVDDTEPTMAESGVLVVVLARVVRAATTSRIRGRR
jgi:hypothetical protein